jgi:(p)ppGpp synthase/HD superfamily hydrolase
MKYIKKFNENNKTDDILNKVIEFTNNAHEFHFKGEGPQLRKYTNEPYIIHPISVCNICKQYTSDICILIAALMHDVLEDTTVSIEIIREFLSQHLEDKQVTRILTYVNDLTDVYTKEDYPGLNRKERKKLEVERMSKITPEAQTIKYADIIDNAPSIIANDPKFTTVFVNEALEKLNVMTKGLQVLKQKAYQALNY